MPRGGAGTPARGGARGRQQAVEPPELAFRVAVLGDNAAGKSTLLRAEVDRELDGSVAPPARLHPQVVTTRTKRYTLRGQRYHVTYVEVPGGERFKTTCGWYTAGAATSVYVMSLHNRESLDHVREWAAARKRACGATGGHLVANRTHASAPAVKPAEAQELAARLGMHFYETSTVNGAGIGDAFRGVVEAVAALVPQPAEPSSLVHTKIKVCPALAASAEYQRELFL